MSQPSSSPTGGVGSNTAVLLPTLIQPTLGWALLLALLGGAFLLHQNPQWGSPASFSLLIGTTLGVAFERGRFCFFCIWRDYIEERNSQGLYAVLAALAVGGIGYAVIFGAFLPNPFAGRLPPEAHIGPVSWVLVLAGVAFGVGMALSGACISGHLYRLGQGYSRAPLALVGSLVGFGLGFYTWNTLYLNHISYAPTVWLPAHLGYGGALLLHLLLLGGLGAWWLRALPASPATTHGERLTGRMLYDRVVHHRWPPIATGAVVGFVGMVAYLRVEPLGVTAQLGTLTRTALSETALLPVRLHGLDTLAGCATQVVKTITDNGWLILGLVLASLAVSLVGGRFQLSKLTVGNSVTAFVGGVLMGWGSLTALGCTVGTLLSGMSAFALSGWVFATAVWFGVWLGLWGSKRSKK